MSNRVAVFGTLRFPVESIEKVLPYLKDLVDSTYKHDGCIAYEVAIDPFDSGLIRFSEIWPDRQSLEKHLSAPHIGPWREKAREYGLSDREFKSYDILSDAIPV